jgi:integrase/recombinase XerD
MPAKKLPRTLTADEVQALMAVPNLSAPTGLRNRCLLAVMHRCGLRVSEACGLKLRDVDWATGEIRLLGKGGAERIAYLDDRTLELLKRWKEVRRDYAAGKPHLFTTLDGGPVSRKYVWAMMQRYARRAGIERKLGPHSLRHTFATELLRADFDIREVQEALGHADVRNTQIYTHVHSAELRRKLRERA